MGLWGDKNGKSDKCNGKQNKNVLREYLEEHEKEVENIMLAMYDEKEILLEYIESERCEENPTGIVK